MGYIPVSYQIFHKRRDVILLRKLRLTTPFGEDQLAIW